MAVDVDSFARQIERGVQHRAKREFVQALECFDAARRLRPGALGASCQLAATHLQAGDLARAEAVYLSVCQAGPKHADAWAGLGHVNRRRGNLPEALALFRKAAALEPGRPGLQCEVAAALRDLSRFEEAGAVLKSLLERDPASWHALLGLGILARRTGKHSESIDLLRQASAANPQNPGILHELAASLRSAGCWQDAAAVYRTLLERDPRNMSAVTGLATVLRQQGDRTTALELLRTALAGEPDHAGARLELATTLRDLAHLDEAATEYTAVLSSHPEERAASIGLGHVCRQRADHAAALLHFRRALALQPDHEGLQAEIASTLSLLGRTDEAEALYRLSAEAHPHSSAPVRALSRLALARGRIDSAVTLAKSACDRAPRDVENLLLLSALYRDSGRLAEAESEIEQALQTGPDHAGAWIEKGLLLRARNERALAAAAFQRAGGLGSQRGFIEAAAEHLLLGEPERARTLYEMVLAAAPVHLDATLGMAELERLAGRHETCLELCSAAIVAYPKHIGPYRLKCRALLRMGRGDEALEPLRAALQADPDQPAFRLELASCLRELTRLDEAVAEYEAVLSAHPDERAAWVGLGHIARQRGDHEQALACFQQALARQPDHLGLQGEVAATLSLLSRLDEAEAIYRSAAQTHPQHALPLRGLSRVASARGQLDPAIAFARSACDREPANAENVLLLASLYRDAGRAADAEPLIGQLLLNSPNHPGAWIEQGLLLRARNERRLALSAFERAAALDPQRGHVEAAAEYLALGQPDRARMAYGQVLAMAPRHLGALLGLAELEALAGHYETCVERCDAAIAAYPQQIGPYRRKCLTLVQLDRADEALVVVEQFKAAGSNVAEADALLLQVLRIAGKRTESMAALAQLPVPATQSFPLWFEALLTRLAFHDLEGAKTALQNPPALKMRERSRVHHAEGMLADLEWRIDDAIAAFRAALDIQPADAGSLDNLARMYFLRADADLAAQYTARLIGQTASSRTLRGESINPSQNLLGQLLNELRLEQPLVAKLAALSAKPPQRRLGALLTAVRANRRFTGPAIYLLLALRQAGALSTRPEKATGTAVIPRKIMQYWDQPEPPGEIQRLMAQWAETHPDFLYRRFDHAAAREYLRDSYPLDVLNAYRHATHPAQKSDLFRLAYLLREGGFYIDADDRCVGQISTLLDPGISFIGYQELYATVGNNFLGCAAGEPVIGRALELAVEALNRGDADTLWLATGPGLMTRAFAELLAAQRSSWRDWLCTRRILDRGEMSRTSSPHALLRYKETQRGWLRSVFKSRAQRGRGIDVPAGGGVPPVSHLA